MNNLDAAAESLLAQPVAFALPTSATMTKVKVYVDSIDILGKSSNLLALVETHPTVVDNVIKPMSEALIAVDSFDIINAFMGNTTTAPVVAMLSWATPTPPSRPLLWPRGVVATCTPIVATAKPMLASPGICMCDCKHRKRPSLPPIGSVKGLPIAEVNAKWSKVYRKQVDHNDFIEYSLKNRPVLSIAQLNAKWKADHSGDDSKRSKPIKLSVDLTRNQVHEFVDHHFDEKVIAWANILGAVNYHSKNVADERYLGKSHPTQKQVDEERVWLVKYQGRFVATQAAKVARNNMRRKYALAVRARAVRYAVYVAKVRLYAKAQHDRGMEYTVRAAKFRLYYKAVRARAAVDAAKAGQERLDRLYPTMESTARRFWNSMGNTMVALDGFDIIEAASNISTPSVEPPSIVANALLTIDRFDVFEFIMG